MGACKGDCYCIFVGGRGDATVRRDGKAVWTHRSKEPGAAAEVVCDALVEALSWTAQRHTGRIMVELPERGLANELIGPSPIEHHSRLSSIMDEARVLLTWFESTDVALCDDAQVA